MCRRVENTYEFSARRHKFILCDSCTKHYIAYAYQQTDQLVIKLELKAAVAMKCSNSTLAQPPCFYVCIFYLADAISSFIRFIWLVVLTLAS